MASFIFGEGRHLREAHGNIKACHERVADQIEPRPPQEKTLVSRGTEPGYGAIVDRVGLNSNRFGRYFLT